jgi:hypothetical protein
MKIRIHDDTVRLRLDRDEVERVGRGETVTCRTHFPRDRVLVYCLGVHDGPQIAASFHDHTISVVVPRARAERWALTGEISLHGDESAGGTTLKLLIEKDFECLDPRPGEDQSNRFPNPKAGA